MASATAVAQVVPRLRLMARVVPLFRQSLRESRDRDNRRPDVNQMFLQPFLSYQATTNGYSELTRYAGFG
jgi:hypothetical protein